MVDRIQELSGKRVAVLGAGISGIAAARLARASHAGQVVLLDEADGGRFGDLPQQLASEGILMLCGDAARGHDGACDLAVVSPGVPLAGALATAIRSHAGQIQGELEFAFRYCPWPVYAVTGTNGKTTTVELLVSCLKSVGRKVIAGGNIGMPLSQVVLDNPPLDCVVAEVSSFQLECAPRFHPSLGILLNVTPDHLNRHGTLDNYRAIKTRMLEQIAYCGHAVCNAALDRFVRYPQGVGRSRIWSPGEYNAQAAMPEVRDFAVTAQGVSEIAPDGAEKTLINRSSLQLRGNHNLQNVAAVIAAMDAMGFELPAYRMALENFQSGAHRIQTIASANGVTYIDDSKATDVDALIQALRTIGPSAGKNVILIAGGLDKGCSLSEVKSELRMYVKGIYLIGQCRHRLAGEWGEHAPCVECDTIEQAVELASQGASSGDTVLLSPGCASQDQFRDYVERGERFRNAVEAQTAAR